VLIFCIFDLAQKVATLASLVKPVKSSHFLFFVLSFLLSFFHLYNKNSSLTKIRGLATA